MAPDKIDRYVIQEELGRGGMATVYRAYDPHFERTVAVKVLPREFMHEPEFRARFGREAKTIAALEHSAIVSVYDYGEDDGQPFLVMRHMTGGSLTERLRQGPLPIEEAARILQRVGSALDVAHQKGIIHRDLKPSNILFDQYGEAYLADFGIVHIATSTAALTASGSLVGTPAYMSPEQVYGDKQIDGRSDIYALGVILFQMLTGGTPYSADTPARMMMKHVMDPIPLVAEKRPDLPSDYDEVIARAMAKDREQRFPTATALSAALVTATKKMEKPPFAEAQGAGSTGGIPATSESTESVVSDVSGGPGMVEPPGPVIWERAHPRPLEKEESVIPRPATGVQVPKWVWFALGALLIICVGTAALIAWLAGNDRLPFLSQDATATIPAVIVSVQQDQTATAEITPQIDAEATELAAGRLATATARAGQAGATETSEPTVTPTASREVDADATRVSAIAARETLAAESAAATATSSAMARPEGSIQPQFGPESGRLAHELDSFIETRNTGLDVQDFLLQAKVENPYSAAEAAWDFGFIFRQEEIDQELRLVIRSDASWNLNNRRGDQDNFIGEGEVEGLLNLREGGANDIMIIAQADRGFFFVNQSFAALLDLSSRTGSGDIAIGTGFYGSSEQEGAATSYDEFAVWQLAPSFGPRTNELVHVEDGLIKSRGADVDLANFMSDVVFINPYAASVGGWDIGFAFRSAGVGEQYWLIVESSDLWSLIDRQNEEDTFIDEGSLETLELGTAGANRLTLIALDDKAYFFVNDDLVAELDISSRSNSGDIEVVSTFFIGNEIEGESTRYENFTVWPLP